MLGGEHWGMVSLFVHWDVLLQTAMKHNLFFTCRNSLEVFCPLIPLRYHMCKHQASRIHIELGSLMSVVAMSLQMEIRVFIPEDHPSDGSSFPSTSTYLQSKSSWCPSLNSQGVRGRMSHMWPITHLFSHREVVGHKAPWASYQCHVQRWDCTFPKEGNSTHWGTQLSLS